ncbi:hypothetical protein HYH02_002033 [Chlamydomonas schloesseri]|uniref:Potassium channel tetramerisation-type BTB domain-containing protein n=1 Tax=Chlamydomonas schloesseri TaxID=2026947 RepID=A0A835WWA8_9CHLO|nr:hypothetical protein HYH02_002033 [Chlamydomonas schloesseri]|eukprot:KAG2453826.1 hypothetical protein HYH02_002033 [Chlamydomonas schloesseri]
MLSSGDVHSPVVSFNVGGQHFTTLRETLLKEANSRLALIARGAIPSAKDPATGAFVLDRDGKHFALILNWLRDGWVLLPRNAEERRELLQEIRYYQLSGFEGWLRTQEVLSDAGGYNAAEYAAMESPRPRMQHAPLHQPFTSYGYGASTLASPPGSATMASPPRGGAATFATATATFGGGGGAGAGPGHASAWGAPPATAGAAPSPGYAAATGGYGGASLGRTSPLRSPGLGLGLTSTWGPGGAGAGAAAGGGAGTTSGSGVAASLRETFLAATAPQRPAAHVAPYSLPSTADEAASWTSKYLRGNEGLRELVNTLLELAYVAPHRSLQAGKSHLSVHVACWHGSEVSLVGSKEEQLRSKLLEIRVRGALGWSFELTLRPSSDAVLWDKYGSIAAAVQDNWFVLGAILRDQFGVVLEEDPAARTTCAACRRTCLAVTLNKIY